jgi:hypothetical protein
MGENFWKKKKKVGKFFAVLYVKRMLFKLTPLHLFSFFHSPNVLRPTGVSRRPDQVKGRRLFRMRYPQKPVIWGSVAERGERKKESRGIID